MLFTSSYDKLVQIKIKSYKIKGLNHMNKNKRSTFSGKLGFVLSAAGASVGLGNIWRFPYLAAKYGGGIFLLIYIILALDLWLHHDHSGNIFRAHDKKESCRCLPKLWKVQMAVSVGGWINAIIPILIVPYYSVIGGWVIKYLVDYFSWTGTGSGFG